MRRGTEPVTTNAYQIWLTFDGENQKLRFPVHPEKISLKQGSSNQSVDIAGLGEVTIMQEKPEAEVSWSSFFPNNPFPGMQVSSLTWPEEIKFKIKTWMGSKKPCHLIVTGTKINCHVTIEQFDCSEEGGAIGDLNYTIKLKEYRQPTIRQVAVDVKTETATVNDAEARVDNTVTPSTCTVVKGDCLWNIAKKYLGDGSRYKEIYEANKAVIDAHRGGPNMIWPGDVLKIPA